jgi:hypothetical protein
MTSAVSLVFKFVLFIAIVVVQLSAAVTDEQHQDASSTVPEQSSRDGRQFFYPRPHVAAVAAPYNYLFANPWGASPVRPPGIRNQPNINPYFYQQQQFNPFSNYIYRQQPLGAPSSAYQHEGNHR